LQDHLFNLLGNEKTYLKVQERLPSPQAQGMNNGLKEKLKETPWGYAFY